MKTNCADSPSWCPPSLEASARAGPRSAALDPSASASARRRRRGGLLRGATAASRRDRPPAATGLVVNARGRIFTSSAAPAFRHLSAPVAVRKFAPGGSPAPSKRDSSRNTPNETPWTASAVGGAAYTGSAILTQTFAAVRERAVPRKPGEQRLRRRPARHRRLRLSPLRIWPGVFFFAVTTTATSTKLIINSIILPAPHHCTHCAATPSPPALPHLAAPGALGIYDTTIMAPRESRNDWDMNSKHAKNVPPNTVAAAVIL